MTAKHFDRIIGQPTTESMNSMTEQMDKMVATVKTTSWREKYGSLVLVLDKDNYKHFTRDVGATIDRLANLAPVNK